MDVFWLRNWKYKENDMYVKLKNTMNNEDWLRENDIYHNFQNIADTIVKKPIW